MARMTLNASARTATGKGANRQLRRDGKVPAVIYGSGKEATSLAVDPKQVLTVLHGPLGRNTPIDLHVEGDEGGRLAIIKDYQVHPTKRRLLHVDLWEVDADKELELDVPFRKVGRAAAEQRGAKVRQVRFDVRVRCTADNVPAAIEYDMSQVEGDLAAISISEVTMPEGVTAVYKDDYSVLQLKIPRAEPDEGDEEAEVAEA